MTTQQGSSINDIQFRDEVEEQVPADGQLPEIGQYTPPLPPNKEYMVRVPANIQHLLDVRDVVEKETNVTKQRVFLKFDKNNPLVVTGGEYDGHPLTGSFSNIPRPRGRDKVPVSDMAYFLIDGCHFQVNPKTPKDWYDACLRAGNLMVKIISGRTGQCRPDQNIYIENRIVDPESGQQSVSWQEVPDMKGCGKRYYTSAFRLTDGTYAERLSCGQRSSPTGQPGPELACGARPRVRRVERGS